MKTAFSYFAFSPAYPDERTNYANVDFPAGRYCDENISSISGTLTIRANIPRPKTRFDRILSLPIIRKTVTTQGGVDVQGTIQENIKGAVIGALSFGLFGGPSVKYKTLSHEEITRGKIFDLFMTLDENYETVSPSKCIRVHTFDEITIYENDKVKKIDFFDGMPDDAKLWDAYANVLGMSRIELLNKFSNNVISDWDRVFFDDIAPLIIKKLINESTIVPLPIGNFDLTNTNKYSGKEQLLKYNFSASTTKTRVEILRIDILYNFNSAIGLPERETLIKYLTLNVENLTVNYSTAHYNGRIFSGYVGNDLLDTVLLAPTVSIPTPLNFDEQRNPRNEDIYIVNKLIEHLNSNLEYYNKILWYKLDVDRRFMLLDGFDIQIFNDFGLPIGSRSLASVVKNELITVVGNSLVFPVAAGYRVSQSYILEKTADGDAEQVTLFDHYKPLTPVPPYRISVPSRGVFAEAVQGACDACEKVKENSSQDWTKFTTDEPTPIAQLQPPVPTITDWKAAWKEFAPPLINIQNAPAAPEPGVGFAGLTELLGKSGIFKDITGLDANQQNVIRTYLSNQENAKAFAEMAKGMATQQHNTQYTDKIMDTLNTARSSDAINQDEYKKLVKDHIQKQIDGGTAQSRQDEQNSKKQESSPIKSAVDLAQSRNVDVSATESNSEGTKSIDVKNKGESSSEAKGKGGSSSLKYDFTVPGSIEAIQQKTANDCWATVTTMMSNWKKQQSQSVDDYIKGIGAEYVPFIQTGITIAKLNDFCNAAGLKTEYTNTEFPVSYYYKILQKNGPIWVIDLENADPKLLHGRLLIGIKGDDSSPTTMFTIIDPASGKQYNEDLPTFVSKMENVVKTLDAIKDVQIPLLIYYKDSYDKSKFSDTSKSDATIGAPPPSQRNVPLPDYPQKGNTCQDASLLTALILSDKESSGSGLVNPNIVGICNAVLVSKSKNKISIPNDDISHLTTIRDRLRKPGTMMNESEYQDLSNILDRCDAHDLEALLFKLDLDQPKKSQSNNTLAKIFADPLLKGLKSGESAQILWYQYVNQNNSQGQNLGKGKDYHAFLIGRSKITGWWFLSNQQDKPPLHLESISLETIQSDLNKAARDQKTGIVTDPSYIGNEWNGVKVLPNLDFSRPFRNLAPPGSFLAEVDAGLPIGEKIQTWDYVGNGYSHAEVEALFASSSKGHGFLIGEMPAGVFSVYKINPVSSKNASVTEIDKSDSKGGLLIRQPPVFIRAWLRLRTADDSSSKGLGFQVY